MKIVINNLCGFPVINLDDDITGTNIKYAIAKLVAQFLAEYHAVVVHTSDIHIAAQSTASPDENVFAVMLPSRAFLLNYPVHLVEFEYAMRASCTMFTGDQHITIWINNAPDCQNWVITTFEMDADGLPKFEEHFISHKNIDAVWEMFPPTEEVTQRYQFLRSIRETCETREESCSSVSSESAHNLEEMFTHL
jgi:hypothetical protein